MQRILALKESNQLNKYHQQKYMSDNVNAIEEYISSLVLDYSRLLKMV
ncbi:Uncharacterized protein APZ42_034216 [Daphnia magna]|uniref:Uncharacterized protein n=1 Tax=Daphnia magna TaxID=35525 RepID=A0A164KC70_9CRUS|nr:Uncharacterized protein APZ42_034216 [Daphnia magna]